jgi:hypothetical protein
MLKANGLLKLDKNTQIPVFGITPAEAALLVAEHKHNAKGNPFSVDEESIEEIERGDQEEVTRLLKKYATSKVNAMYPRNNLKLPATFEEGIQNGGFTTLPRERLVGTRPGPDILPERGDE